MAISNRTETESQQDTRRRAATLAAGGLLTAGGLKKGGVLGAASVAVGGNFLLEGTKGNSPLFRVLRLNRRATSKAAVVPHGGGSRVEAVQTINRDREELYRFWRDFENLPSFMDYLESVETLDERRSRWTLKLPIGTLEWQAEIYNEVPNELIAWRSLPESRVQHAGSVRFSDATGGRGTIVRAEINYAPPLGRLGEAAALLMPQEPGRLATDALRKLKQLMEAGEITTSRFTRDAMANQLKPMDEGKNNGRSAA